MELEALRTFADLAETGSFSKAAARRNVSQSAVSQRVRALEAHLRVRLVERGQGRQGLALTEEGECLLRAAREILDRADALGRELEALSGSEPVGALRVATVYSLGLHSLTRAMTRFLADFPKVQLHVEYLRTDRIYEALLSGAIDCGVVACPRPRPGIEVVPLASEPLVVVASPDHRLARVGTAGPAQLEGEALVAFDPLIPTRGLIDAWLAEAGIRMPVVHAFDNIETIKRVVEIGQGVAIVPEPTVRREVRDGTLVALPLSGAPLTRPTGILLPRGRPARPALRRFVAVLLGPEDDGYTYE